MIRLDLADIQGNIHRPYGRFGFPITRHLFFNIAEPGAGRAFIEAMRPRVTTAEPWPKQPDGSIAKPDITLNLGLTWRGLLALDLPTATLRQLPDEFIDGMRCRADLLGDVGGSAPEHWDPIWRDERTAPERFVHLWVSLSVGADRAGEPLSALAEWTDWLRSLTAAGGVTLLDGHGGDGAAPWQDSRALMKAGPDGAMAAVPQEHFGFTDGIGDPVFRGQFDAAAEAVAVVGGGKIASGPYDVHKSWSALETGEFILGQVDEGQEFPVATQPANFARNGTFMVYRKLGQDVAAFEAEMTRQARLWMAVTGETDEVAAGETVRAKIVGRWRSGVPLTAAPTWVDHQQILADYADCIEIALRKPRDSREALRLADYNRMLTGFRYGADRDGAACPLGAHVRRANPRDMLDPHLSDTEGATTLTNRRRILRRGLPFQDADGSVGVVFMAICSSIFRQFEFIQQQWISYGLDFEGGNDTCPLIGHREAGGKHVIPTEDGAFIAADLPEFVTTRGGEYFFLPSMNAIRMLAMGTIDPT